MLLLIYFNLYERLQISERNLSPQPPQWPLSLAEMLISGKELRILIKWQGTGTKPTKSPPLSLSLLYPLCHASALGPKANAHLRRVFCLCRKAAENMKIGRSLQQTQTETETEADGENETLTATATAMLATLTRR